MPVLTELTALILNSTRELQILIGILNGIVKEYQSVQKLMVVTRQKHDNPSLVIDGQNIEPRRNTQDAYLDCDEQINIRTGRVDKPFSV